MNKKLRELLDAINAKKAEVVNFAEAGKIEDATKAKDELVEMQKQFDILKDMYDPEGTGQAKHVPDPAKPVKSDESNSVKDIANVFRGYKNALTGKTGADGGYTVPEDVRTEVQKLREEDFHLFKLANVVKTATASGARTFQKRASIDGFKKVGEMGHAGEIEGPQFARIEYKIADYAGYMPAPQDLIEDSDANIKQVVVDWLVRNDIATRNRLVIEKINEKQAVDLGGFDGIKEAFLKDLAVFRNTSVVLTNTDGMLYLDTLKDANGNPMLRPGHDETNTFKGFLSIGVYKVPVVEAPTKVLPTADGKIPFVIGDLKEYVTIFDRQQMKLYASQSASVNGINAFTDDVLLTRAKIRLDNQVVDDQAIVNGYITLAAKKSK